MHAADLKPFQTVVRLGSMSRASEELHTTQSNVTARIQTLEQHLGVRRPLRTNRGFTLFPRQLVGLTCPEGRVAIHSLDGSEIRVQTVFVRRRDTYASSALTCFLDAARATWEPIQAAAE